jgi:hypothetical protein
MNNIDIEVEQIRIVLNTNIPSKTKVDLTKKIFHGSYGDTYYENYPFFTSSVKIPKRLLLQKSFDDKIKFFFNRNAFLETILLSDAMDTNDVKETSTDIDDTIVDYNITTMIKLLFETVYPYPNNNKDSFNMHMLKRDPFTFSLDGTIPRLFKNMIPSLNVNFTYIKLDGKDYTVTSTCLLNDIINHPGYNELIYKLVEFKKWKVQASIEIKSKLTKLTKKIQFNIDKDFGTKAKIEYEIQIKERVNEEIGFLHDCHCYVFYFVFYFVIDCAIDCAIDTNWKTSNHKKHSLKHSLKFQRI